MRVIIVLAILFWKHASCCLLERDSGRGFRQAASSAGKRMLPMEPTSEPWKLVDRFYRGRGCAVQIVW
jgi:hypothetical protein